MHSHAGLPPEAPGWSLAIGMVAKGAVWVAFALFIAGVVLTYLKREKPAALSLKVGVAGVVTALLSLLSLFLLNRFEYRYVYGHGQSDYELMYKIAGMWGGQEGSVLLWTVCTATFLLIGLRNLGELRRLYVGFSCAILAVLSSILAFESPFDLMPQIEGAVRALPEGAGLNASLLNYWMVIHPPTIFSGFGSLAPVFALALTAMVSGRLDEWVKPVRPLAITGLAILGLGVCMGGFWAYETLGWGGFWAWDPVENTSFVPWIALAAFIHGLFVQVTRGKWKLGNALMAGIPFVAFCYGTFMTRSGFLGDTSVHTFAEMDSKALWILICMVWACVAGLLGVFFWRMKKGVEERDTSEGDDKPLNRTFFYTTGIWLLYGTLVITAVGMSWPLILSAMGRDLQVVTEQQYHQILGVIFPIFCLAIALGPLVSWRGLPAKELLTKILNPLAVSIFSVGLLLLWLKSGWQGVPADPQATLALIGGIEVSRTAWVLFLSFLCIFAVSTNIFRAVELRKGSKLGLGGLVSHVGLMLALLGLIFSRGFEQKQEVLITTAADNGAFGSVLKPVGPTLNYADRRNRLEVHVSGPQFNFIAKPGLYFEMGQEGEPAPMVWPSIKRFPLFDYYTMVYDMVFEASEPLSLQQGEKASYEEMIITYNGLETEGELGMTGARFIADVTVQFMNGTTVQAKPAIELGEGGEIQRQGADLGNGFRLVLSSIDAASKSASLQFDYAEPAFIADVFYKPLTWLVWLGVGIMTLGGFMAAGARRYRRKDSLPAPDSEPESAEPEDAP